MNYTSSTRLHLFSSHGKIGETSTKYKSTQDCWNEDGKRTPPAPQPGESEHPKGPQVTRDGARAGWMMAPVLSLLFRLSLSRPLQPPIQASRVTLPPLQTTGPSALPPCQTTGPRALPPRQTALEAPQHPGPFSMEGPQAPGRCRARRPLPILPPPRLESQVWGGRAPNPGNLESQHLDNY